MPFQKSVTLIGTGLATITGTLCLLSSAALAQLNLDTYKPHTWMPAYASHARQLVSEQSPSALGKASVLTANTPHHSLSVKGRRYHRISKLHARTFTMRSTSGVEPRRR